MSSILSEKSEREVAEALHFVPNMDCARAAIRAVLETDELQKLNKAASRAFVTMAQGFPSTDATNRKSRELILEALAPFAKLEQNLGDAHGLGGDRE